MKQVRVPCPSSPREAIHDRAEIGSLVRAGRTGGDPLDLIGRATTFWEVDDLPRGGGGVVLVERVRPDLVPHLAFVAALSPEIPRRGPYDNVTIIQRASSSHPRLPFPFDVSDDHLLAFVSWGTGLDLLLAQKLGSKAHRQQLFQGHHLQRLPLTLQQLLVIVIVRSGRVGRTDHVDGRGQATELSDELSTDPTGRNRRRGDIAGDGDSPEILDPSALGRPRYQRPDFIFFV